MTPSTKSLIDLILSSFSEAHCDTEVVKICLSDHYLIKTCIFDVKHVSKLNLFTIMKQLLAELLKTLTKHYLLLMWKLN